MNVKNIEIGKSYYTINRGWGQDVKYGVVQEIIQGTHVRLKGVAPHTTGNFGAKINEIFNHEEHAYAYIKEEDEYEVKRYMETINSIDDLVRFAAKCNISGCDEYGDRNTREAYLRKAKEFGIDIY